MDSQGSAVTVATGLILVTLLVAGPPLGIDIVSSNADRLGDGTADVTVIQPTGDTIRVTEGRFGTGVWYVRLPNLVVDVEQFEGQPRVQYAISIPGLDLDRTKARLVTGSGRLRIPVDDRALAERPGNSTYRGSVQVRVQSLSAEKTVLNRTVEVTVE